MSEASPSPPAVPPEVSRATTISTWLIAAMTTAWGMRRFLVYPGKFDSVFSQVGVTIPTLTRLVIVAAPWIAWMFALGISVSTVATVRHGTRRWTLLWNCAFIALVWILSTLLMEVLLDPLANLLQGIGSKK